MGEKTIITRKIELWIDEDTKEKRTEVWRKLHKMNNDVFRAANLIISNQYFNETFKERIILNDSELSGKSKEISREIETLKGKMSECEETQEREKLETKLKTKYKSLNLLKLEAQHETEAYYTTGEKNSTYQLLGKLYPGMSSYIKSSLNDQVTKNFKNELLDVKKGARALRSFRKGMPIPFTKDAMRIEKVGDQILLHWLEGVNFILRFGQDRSNNRLILERVLEKTYEIGDSQIQVKDKKIFLLLVVKIPIEKGSYNDKLAIGVDLGLSIPAYCALSEGYARLPIGSYNDFIRVRTQMQARRRNLQRSLRITKGGKGRGKKLKALEALRANERNFVHTYNHTVSHRIVEFAQKYNTGVVKLELLEGYGTDEKGMPLKGDFVLRNWSYYELQKMIEEKASKIGIKVIYVDPYHSSQMCSECGHYEEGQREQQAEFKCKNPTCKNFDKIINADYNAALNIARSTKIVTQKEDCEYYKHRGQDAVL